MITQKIAKVGSSTTTNRYVFDGLDRLVSENISGAVTSTATYSYDLVGNRTNAVLNSVTNNYAFSNGCDRLLSWGTNNECTANYNAAGCVTSLVFSATNKLYLTWNSEYQLTQVNTSATVVVERNAYDAVGRRAWSWGWDGTVTNFFLYDGQNLVADVDSTGGMRRAYAYGPGIDNILSMTVYTGSTVKTYFYLKDHLGTVHAVTDSTGTNIVERYIYDAWGKLLDIRNGSGAKLTQTTVGNRFLWSGREYSWKTGLYFHRSRYYIPQLGRWCSNDRIGIAGGLDQYVACANNPVNFRDWSGLCTEDGQQFVDFYLNRMMARGPQDSWPAWGGWNPFHVIGDVLQDTRIDIGQNNETSDLMYSWRGRTYTAPQMGNVAAGYVTTRLWSPIVAAPSLVIAEGASFLDPRNRGRSFGQVVRDVWGSFSHNFIGSQEYYGGDLGGAWVNPGL